MEELKQRIAKEIDRLREVNGDYLYRAPPNRLLTDALDCIEALEAQLAARDAEIVAWLRTQAHGIECLLEMADGAASRHQLRAEADRVLSLATAIGTGTYK